MCARLAVGLLLLLLLAPASSHEHGHLMMPSPALAGFTPVPLNASFTRVPLPVEGRLPSYLSGTLYRGAPGAWPDGWWLDALVTLHSFEFGDESVHYSMRYCKDEVYNRTRAPPAQMPQAGPGSGEMPHPANSSWPTGVAFHHVDGQLLSSTGVSNANQLDPATLEPIQLPFEYADELGAPYLAPTHTVTVNGSVLHHLVYGVQTRDSEQGYTVTEIRPGSRARQVLAKIASPRASSWRGLPSFQHQVSATEDFYVMLEAPCYYPEKPSPLGSVDWVDWGWNPLAGTHIRLLDRRTGQSQVWPVTHNLFAIHHINAYKDEASNSLVLDVIQTFPSIVPCSQAFKSLTLNHSVNDWQQSAKGMQMSTPRRLQVPLDRPGARISPQELGSARGMEFPTIRYDQLAGRKYTYAYGVFWQGKASAYYDALIKLDVQRGNHTTWGLPQHYVGEPIFVPDPEGSAEDDGVLMTNVLDAVGKQTFLVVLDARTMTLVAKAGPTPIVIPHGYHGRYFDDRS